MPEGLEAALRRLLFDPALARVVTALIGSVVILVLARALRRSLRRLVSEPQSDRVQLGGTRGDVIDIGVLRTTLMECGEWVKGDLYNGRVVRIANSFIFKEPVFNYSADFPFLWDEIRIPVRYGSDHRLARAMLANVAERIVGHYARNAEGAWRRLVERYGIERMQVQPMVTLVATDNWIELTLRYAVDHRQRRTTQDAIHSAVLDEIEASEGKVQLASTTLELARPSALEVRLTRPAQSEPDALASARNKRARMRRGAPAGELGPALLR